MPLLIGLKQYSHIQVWFNTPKYSPLFYHFVRKAWPSYHQALRNDFQIELVRLSTVCISYMYLATIPALPSCMQCVYSTIMNYILVHLALSLLLCLCYLFICFHLLAMFSFSLLLNSVQYCTYVRVCVRRNEILGHYIKLCKKYSFFSGIANVFGLFKYNLYGCSLQIVMLL